MSKGHIVPLAICGANIAAPFAIASSKPKEWNCSSLDFRPFQLPFSSTNPVSITG